MLPSALRGTSGSATMKTPGGSGTLPWSQSPVRGAPASPIRSEFPLQGSGLSLRPYALSSPPLWSLRRAHNSHDMGIPLPEHLVLSGRTDADSRGVVNFACTEF
jgi:hypothetical protein